jgi:hypothetical protein
MSDTKKVNNLEIEEDLDFQQKEWMAERIGWVFMILLILVALIGGFGVGPVSATALGGDADPLWVEYQRFGRYKSPTTLRIYLNSEAIVNDEIVFWVEDDYLRKFQIEDILPNPDSVEIGDGRYIYHFKANQTSTGVVPDEITFYMQSEVIGPVKGSIGIDEDLEYELPHFIFP